ncbi:MAG TPA: hypothetical protein VGL81_15720 [Polyangiaceae bacterium]|jgi:hypothetical protein
MRAFPVLFTLLLLAGSARADILPDPSSADAHCTLAEQCVDGVECPAGIRQDAGVVQACADAQKAKGLEYRCHRGGNYFATAVYCRADARGSWSPPPPAPSVPPVAPSASPAQADPTAPPAHPAGGRCSLSPEPVSGGMGAVGGAMLALLLLRRRARRFDGETALPDASERL